MTADRERAVLRTGVEMTTFSVKSAQIAIRVVPFFPPTRYDQIVSRG